MIMTLQMLARQHYRMSYDTTSLNALSDCNHTCKMYGIGTGPSLDYLNIRSGAKARKIYHLLSTRNQEGSNVQHLNTEFDEDDDSLKLAPKVLGFISRLERPSRKSLHYNFVHPLSIMYEIIRSWEMPELCETRVSKVHE